MTTVRELVVKVNIGGDAESKSKSLIGGFADVEAAINLMVNAVKIAGKAIAAFTTDIASSGDEIAKQAKNIGISAESLQELGFAAKIAGASTREVQTAIQRMGKGLNDARRTGTGPFADALEQMGVSLESLQGLSPDETFTELADSIAKIEDPMTRAALAQDLFGRGGKTLLPLLNEGKAGIEAMRAEFVELGGGFTEDGAAAAEEFTDAMLRMETVVDSIKIGVGEELLPVMQGLIDNIRAWFEANREVIKQKLIDFVNKSVAAFEKLLPILGKVLDWFLSAIPQVVELIDLLGGLDGVLAIVAVGFSGVGVAVAAATGPIGAIALGVAALIPLIINLTNELEPLEDRLDAINARAVEIRGKSAGKVFANEGIQADMKAAEERFARASKASRLAKIGGNKSDERQLRKAEMAAQRELSRLESKNRRLLENEDVRKGAEEKTSGNESGFRSRQDAGARVREQLGKGKKADALVDRVIRGEITERQALVASDKKPKRGKKKTAKKEDAAVTDAELFKLISKASSEGVGLDSVLQGRKLSGGVPPVISVQITNIDVKQAVNAPVTVTGVPGEDAEDIAVRVENILEDKLQSEYRAAVEELPTLIKR